MEVIDLPIVLTPILKMPYEEIVACPNCGNSIKFLVNNDARTFIITSGGWHGGMGGFVICATCRTLYSANLT